MEAKKAVAEKLVRETLGWWIEIEPGLPGSCLQYEWACAPDSSRSLASERELSAYNALVSKTAELLEMTSQRDEAQERVEVLEKRLECAKRLQELTLANEIRWMQKWEVLEKALRVSNELLLSRAEQGFDKWRNAVAENERLLKVTP